MIVSSLSMARERVVRSFMISTNAISRPRVKGERNMVRANPVAATSSAIVLHKELGIAF
jgi:hypothetical protein